MKKLVYLIVFFMLFSCDRLMPKKGFDEKNLIKAEDMGEYHKLSEDNIKIYLPEGFKELTEEEIRAFHKQIKDEKERYYFEKTYESQRFIKGNFYDYYSEEYASEVIIRTLPYMPFDKSSARYLLYYLRKDHEKFQKVTGIYHNKIKATYSGEASLQYFKAKYRLTRFSKYEEGGEDDNYEMFKTVYLISSRNKTFIFNILTPFEVDFDPFISKIKL